MFILSAPDLNAVRRLISILLNLHKSNGEKLTHMAFSGVADQSSCWSTNTDAMEAISANHLPSDDGEIDSDVRKSVQSL